MEQLTPTTSSVDQPQIGQWLAAWEDSHHRKLWVCSERMHTSVLGEHLEAFFRVHASSKIACRSATGLYRFARAVGGEAAGQAVWQAATADGIIDLSLRDHAAALARRVAEELQKKPGKHRRAS